MRKAHNQKLKLDSILKRLPMLRYLDESQAYILSIQPQWIGWQKKHLNHRTDSSAHLSAFRSGELLIHASDSSIAALIKNQKESLQKALNNGAGAVINKITVKIDLQSTSAANKIQKDNLAKPSLNRQSISKPNQLAISSVKKLQSSVKNQELAKTLNNLADTLTNLSD